MSIPAVSVVVPVYNSEQSLLELIGRLGRVLSARGEYEIILVDDGSVDGSRAAIRRLARDQAFVHGIFLMRNFGQHNALLAGIRAARFPMIVTLDDDLQNPPEEIPKLLAKLDEGYDVVYGVPSRTRQTLSRRLASKLVRFALRGAMGRERAAIVSQFRAFRTQLRSAFEDYAAPFVSIDVLLSWGAARFAALRVEHVARPLGRSQYSFVKLMSHAISMITGFSSWPLRFASIVGFVFTLFGIGVFTFVVARYLVVGRSVPGFPFLASIIAIFSGAQLFALGIIGEYLARVHFRMMNRPPYVLDSSENESKMR
ncbi:MAG TPA: glycosyltransferase family 2 protein [Thermoanaerobaculia bacterium]|nr:glycosyltransferase family 2 protein [Thermoanaerobaculia bacterium]